MRASRRAQSALAIALLSAAALTGGLIAQDKPSAKAPPPQPPPYLRETEDVSNQVFAAEIRKGRVVRVLGDRDPPRGVLPRALREEQGRTAGGPPGAREDPPPASAVVGHSPGSDTVTVVVNFRDDFRIPRFPEPANEARDSVRNQRALRRAEALVAEIIGRRAAGYKEIARTLQEAYKAEVEGTFWLVKAVTAKMPLETVRRLAERKDVMYLEPEQTEDKPPQDANANNDVDDGRARLNSDPVLQRGPHRWLHRPARQRDALQSPSVQQPFAHRLPSRLREWRGQLQHRDEPQPERRLLEPRHLERRHHHRQRPRRERRSGASPAITLDSFKVYP